jgi:2-polyprenyl-3-methyl-5-hydroxy-6-metoxy-1,4-benzoquinol methylase
MTERETCPVCNAATQHARVVHTRAIDRLVHCPACATVFATPQPSDEELQGLYRREYYDETNTRVEVDRRDEERVARVLHHTVLADLLRRYPRLRPGTARETPRALDYGCGPGYFLAECKAAGLDGTGIEFSEMAAKFARERFGVEVHTEPERALRELPTQRYHLVTMWQVLEHTRDPRATIQALATKLAPGGVFCVAVPSLRCWQYHLQGERWFNVRNPTHLVFFSRGGLERLLSEAGLTALRRPVFWGGRADLGLLGQTLQYAMRCLGLGSELRLYALRTDEHCTDLSHRGHSVRRG